jgi:hypothetical protein
MPIGEAEAVELGSPAVLAQLLSTWAPNFRKGGRPCVQPSPGAVQANQALDRGAIRPVDCVAIAGTTRGGTEFKRDSPIRHTARPPFRPA